MLFTSDVTWSSVVRRMGKPQKTADCLYGQVTSKHSKSGLFPSCMLKPWTAGVQLIPEELVRAYKHAMLNIHPALLPNFGGKGFYGSKVHTAVIQSGARFSGPTVHFVDEGCASCLAKQCGI